MRKLIFCFDGTWNGRDDEYDTNIQKLSYALSVFGGQIPFYFAGPGNEDESNVFEQFLGGAFGWGSNDIRDQALQVLASVYQSGDQISAIGFSRGAAIARMFCSKLGSEGVNGNTPLIHFLGCFDTVGAYLPFGPSQQGLFHDLSVSDIVQTACHAVALDEIRESFEPNLMNQRDRITEVWFPGGHSDVGGGNEHTGLSDGALEWMANQMEASGLGTDLPFLQPDAGGHMTIMEMLNNGPRRVGVKRDGEWTDEKPELDRSAFDRISIDPDYRKDSDDRKM